ncbi:hypothetical protein G5I_04657 [Acromyrmex echinatior]|uniref:Uncharacterized protein n=1 Tax=Acromyrmex echinatior TaxID=103372 RepID=F4WG83_ACREC|nr:hypothetical protein G5I_04657 [Acromyrmex echinatior]
MGELSCNEVLTSFGLVPNDALEGDGGTGLAGSQTLRFRDGPHAGSNAYVGHVLQQKVQRTIENRKGAEGRQRRREDRGRSRIKRIKAWWREQERARSDKEKQRREREEERVKEGFRLQYGSQASSGDGNKSEVMILKRQCTTVVLGNGAIRARISGESESGSMNGEKIGDREKRSLIRRETMRVQESQSKTRTLRAVCLTLFDLNETQSETKVTEAILRRNRLSAVMKVLTF